MDGTVLVADDDRTIRTVLTQAFIRAGCKVHATASLVTLLRWVEEGRGDLVISDVIMPDGNGLETLPKISRLRPDLPVIVISAQNTIMTAIKAEQAEAYDYLPKPFDLPDLMKRSARALERKQQARRGADRTGGDELPLVGRTPVMQELYRVVARVLNTDLPVLISGESGTGKSLIARVIHDFSDRRALPFVVAGAADLTGIDAVHGALARAGGGTILFDEIGEGRLEDQGRELPGIADRRLDPVGEVRRQHDETEPDRREQRLREGPDIDHARIVGQPLHRWQRLATEGVFAIEIVLDDPGIGGAGDLEHRQPLFERHGDAERMLAGRRQVDQPRR